MSELFELIKAGDLNRIKQHIVAGELNQTDEHGLTPLQISCISGNAECTDLLLSVGANPNDGGANGCSALHLASLSRSENAGAQIDSLLNAGARLEAKARGVVACVQMRNWTPIMVAAAEGGAAAVRSLVKHRAEVNASDLEGMTPLMLAVSLGCNTEEKVGLLLFAGALPRARSRDGKSALDYARERAKLLEAGKNSAVVGQSVDAFQMQYIERMTALGVSVDRLEETYPNLKLPGSRDVCDATIAQLSRVADVLKRAESD